MPEMVAPRALVFRPLIKENEDSGNEIGKNKELFSLFCARADKSLPCWKIGVF